MSILDKLERKLRPFAIPNLTLALIAAQVIGYSLVATNAGKADQMVLIMGRVYAGGILAAGNLFVHSADTVRDCSCSSRFTCSI